MVGENSAQVYEKRSISLYTETTLLITFQYGLSIRHSIRRVRGRSESGRKASPSFSSPIFFPPAPLESLILRPFYVWCPSISNPNLSAQLLQPRGRGRTGYKTRCLQPFDFDCNVVNRLKQTNNNLPSTPIYFHRWALSWTYCGNTRTNDMHMRSNILGLIQIKISVNNVITASWVTNTIINWKFVTGLSCLGKVF